MNAQTTPFKVGETYPDKEGVHVEIIHIRQDACGWPIIGIVRDTQHDTSCVRTYQLTGRHGNISGLFDLIPPAKPKKRVPLGPEDVPPGSFVRYAASHALWWSVLSVRAECIILAGSSFGWFACMEDGFLIKRPGDEFWQPMWKEIDGDGGSEG